MKKEDLRTVQLTKRNNRGGAVIPFQGLFHEDFKLHIYGYYWRGDQLSSHLQGWLREQSLDSVNDARAALINYLIDISGEKIHWYYYEREK